MRSHSVASYTGSNVLSFLEDRSLSLASVAAPGHLRSSRSALASRSQSFVIGQVCMRPPCPMPVFKAPLPTTSVLTNVEVARRLLPSPETSIETPVPAAVTSETPPLLSQRIAIAKAEAMAKAT